MKRKPCGQPTLWRQSLSVRQEFKEKPSVVFANSKEKVPWGRPVAAKPQRTPGIRGEAQRMLRKGAASPLKEEYQLRVFAGFGESSPAGNNEDYLPPRPPPNQGVRPADNQGRASN